MPVLQHVFAVGMGVACFFFGYTAYRMKLNNDFLRYQQQHPRPSATELQEMRRLFNKANSGMWLNGHVDIDDEDDDDDVDE
jgi:hypothetical protein